MEAYKFLSRNYFFETTIGKFLLDFFLLFLIAIILDNIMLKLVKVVIFLIDNKRLFM